MTFADDYNRPGKAVFRNLFPDKRPTSTEFYAESKKNTFKNIFVLVFILFRNVFFPTARVPGGIPFENGLRTADG